MSNEYPHAWEVVLLGDVAEIEKGTSFTSKDLVAGSIPVIAGGRQPAYYHKYANRSGETITVSASGANAGYVAFHNKPIFASDCTTIKSDSNQVTTRYIYHYLKHKQKGLYRRRNGSAQPHLYPRDLATYKISYPPPAEQFFITGTLDSVDQVIERTKDVIFESKALRNSLKHELLTRGLPGHHTKWKEAQGLGTIPATWKVAQFDEVAEISFSNVDKRIQDGEIPVKLCNYTDVFYNRYIYSGIKFMLGTATHKEIQRWGLNKGDVLFTKDSETPNEIGIPAYVEEDMPDVLCGYHLGLARPKPNIIEGNFLSIVMGSDLYRTQFARIANGVTRFGLTLNSTRAIQMILPPILEQIMIGKILRQLDLVSDRLNIELDMLIIYKEAVLTLLMSEGYNNTEKGTEDGTN